MVDRARSSSTTRILCVACCAVAMLGCASRTPREPPTNSMVSYATSRWEHLVHRYDVDGDSSIGPAEYPRSPEAFDRLDANDDGKITREDFDLDVPSPSQILAQALLHRAFHTGENPEDLGAEDIEATLEEYDGDGDARLGRTEFEGLLDDRGGQTYPTVMATMLGNRSEFDRLLEVLDEDRDEHLSRSELTDYHHHRYNALFVEMIEYEPPPEEVERAGGPRAGDVAPDFTLRPPDGGAPVTLSSFAGDRPVALVFGSYS